MLAAQRGNLDAVQVLLGAGASVEPVTWEGQSCADFARGHKAVYDIIDTEFARLKRVQIAERAAKNAAAIEKAAALGRAEADEARITAERRAAQPTYDVPAEFPPMHVVELGEAAIFPRHDSARR